MRTKNLLRSWCVLGLLLTATAAHALHEESPSAIRLTSADDHTHTPGQSWGNWFAFSSTQDLAGKGAQRAPGRQIFVFNLGFYDCAEGTTKSCDDPNAPIDCQQTPCPPAGTPYLRQVTNGIGDPDNPSVSTATSAAVNAGRLDDAWVAFDALGSFGCDPSNTACLASPAAARRQIFMINLHSGEMRQITNSALGDSVKPSLNRTGGMMVFTSTARITGVLNPTGVPQVFVAKLTTSGSSPGVQFKQVSVGPPPASVIGLGPSINPSINENGTGVAFQSRSDLMATGLDTGIYQVYYVDFEKDPRVFDGDLIRVTNGNASSERPYVGFSKVPNPAPGEENPRKVVLFDSKATNLPGGMVAPGSRIYEVAVNELLASQAERRQPAVTTITPFSDCTGPMVDQSGSRIVFTCTGDPLQNGSTGNQAFALTRKDAKLYQLTGAGEVRGRVSNSIGQWFLSLATTSDLTQGGSCGSQLYIIDFAPGKWVAATSLGQLPPDAVAQGPNSRIGQRNFAILPGSAPGGGSTTAITSRDGTTTYPVPATRNVVDQGNISMVLGALDVFDRETTIEVPQNRIKLPPIRTQFGAVCIQPTGPGRGDIDCDGGREGIDYVTAKDHYTDDADPVCTQGCRDDASCPDSYAGLLPIAPFACPFCDFPDVTPLPDTGTCFGGPMAGYPCRTTVPDPDAVCRVGLTCDENDLTAPSWVCQGHKTFEPASVFGSGAARINFPVRLTLSQAAGADREFCTADDTMVAADPIDTLLDLTTGIASGSIADADPVRDDAAPGVRGVLTPNTTITVQQTGAPFDCTRLRAGDLAGAGLVGVIPLLNMPNVVPNAEGLRDVLLSVRYVPDSSALSSCSPFCLADSECNDGNPCNGVETCQSNRCAGGTPIDCDDGNSCNGSETCNPANGTCGPGVPLSCDDGNTCTTDVCVPASGCAFTPNVGQACNDNDLCTSGDQCVADPNTVASCQGTPTALALSCNDGQLCNGIEACNPATGACQTTPTSCNDQNSCTTDSCNPAGNGGSGACVNSTLPENTPCNDGNACTGPGMTDRCNAAGTCTGALLNCSNGNACDGLETCEPTSGCQAGAAPNCDDGNPCTADSCDAVSGCVHTPLSGSCNDNSACTVGDQCTPSGGTAICLGTPVVCNDGNACNGTETCDPSSGCRPGTPLTCNDGNACTTDSCAPATGCVFAPNTNPCDDGETCTVNDTCSGGQCVGTSTLCDDGNACNGVETCNPANPTQCLPAVAPNCDDGNPCTDDSCNPASGCLHTPNTDTCDDGSACTTGDVCSGGQCVGATLQCSDNNACNGVETCNPSIGCVAGTVPDCNDGDVCSADVCDPSVGCRNSAEPSAYLICRMNVLVDAILATPADELGGTRRKRRFVRQASGAARAVTQAFSSTPSERRRGLKKALRQLTRLRNQLQKSVDSGEIAQAIGDNLIDLTSIAARALQSVGR